MRGDTSKTKRVLLLCLAILAAVASDGRAKIIYVDDDANSLGDGTSWQTAYRYLQDALADANTTDKPVEIRVAQGIYRPDRSVANPDGTGDRTATFQMLSGVALVGGFAGLGGADPNERDVYETILSGDLAGNDVLSEDPDDFAYNPDDGIQPAADKWCLMRESTRRDNSLHVVTTSGVNQTAILDGFTITAGNAYKPPYWLNSRHTANDQGGGITNEVGSPQLIECTIINNSAWSLGGAMCNIGVCKPTLVDCQFVGNFAPRDGGAMSNGYLAGGVQLEMTRCVFESNVSWGYGIAIRGWHSTLTATDCAFTANIASFVVHPVIDSSGCDSIFNRCAFSDNHSAVMVHSQGALAITDCTFTDNLGMGLRLTSCRNVTIERCSFTKNRGWRGGAISGSAGNWTIGDSVFVGNIANDAGGAIRIGGSKAFMQNCTFSQNRAARGGAIIAEGDSLVELTNCILWANQSTEGSSIYLVEDSKSPSTANVSYSLLEGGQASIWHGPTSRAHWGHGNLDGDPCFIDSGRWDPNGTPDDPNDDLFVVGDYHLKSQGGRWDPNSGNWVVDDVTSPCIDAGDPNSPVGDEPQPNGGRINMGAYGGTVEVSMSVIPPG